MSALQSNRLPEIQSPLLLLEPPTIEASDSDRERLRLLLFRQPGFRQRVRQIAHVVAIYYDLSIDEMLSRSRHTEIVWPRHVAMYLAWIDAGGYARIARCFGCDHGTVMNAVSRVKSLIETEPQSAKEVAAIETALKGEL